MEGAFGSLSRAQLKVAKMRLLSSPCLSIRLSACNNSTAERIFMKFDIGEFY
jgi:hypothetical protein